MHPSGGPQPSLAELRRQIESLSAAFEGAIKDIQQTDDADAEGLHEATSLLHQALGLVQSSANKVARSRSGVKPQAKSRQEVVQLDFLSTPSSGVLLPAGAPCLPETLDAEEREARERRGRGERGEGKERER